MTIARLIQAALVAIASLMLIGPASGDTDPTTRLTRPTLVGLDFRDRTVEECAREIARRTGTDVRVSHRGARQVGGVGGLGGFPMGKQGETDPRWRDRRVTLEAQAPVPLWEAIDRLAEAGRIGYWLAESGNMGEARIGLVFEESRADPHGLVQYAGPFRVALGGVHEHHDVVFVRGPWVRYPAGLTIAKEPTIAPPDGGPFYAELRVMAEPGLICRRNGPLTISEAVDERGRSLLAPEIDLPVNVSTLHAVFDDCLAPPVRIPLRHPDGDGPVGKTIRSLSGTIPVEIAVVRPDPVLVVPLAGAEGRTFRGGGYTIEVETARFEPDGGVSLKLTVRENVEPEPAIRVAQHTIVARYQFRFVDSQGIRVTSSSAGTGGDLGRVRISFEFRPGPNIQSGPPAEFRLFGLERVAWEIPFAFRDVPLP